MAGERWRWRWLVLIGSALLVLRLPCSATSDGRGDQLVSRIVFGSCANQSAPQPIWNAIIDFHPDVFIWLGDNIYGDNKKPMKLLGKERTIGPWKNTPRFFPASEREMEIKYKLIKSNPGYSRLRGKAKVIGTWDDHDYGLNDAGKEFDRKIINQKLLLDFLDEPHDSPRRKQAGVYASYTFGPVGRQVKVIILDTRYHRDPISSDGDMLGGLQWAWLEKELKGPATAITIVGSSIQVISNLSATTGPLLHSESWGRFPKERDRLFKLLAETKRDGVFFISGDVHFGEINRYDCAIGYPLYDVTSSGLTQAVEEVVPQAFHFMVRFLFWWTPTTMRVLDQNCKFRSCTYGQPNFGAIKIDWDSTPVSIGIELRNVNGVPVESVNISLSELQARSVNSPASVKTGHQRHCSLEVTLPWIVRYRLAILFYSVLAFFLVALIGLVFVTILVCRRCIHKCKLE